MTSYNPLPAKIEPSTASTVRADLEEERKRAEEKRKQINLYAGLASEGPRGIRKLEEAIWEYESEPISSRNPDFPEILMTAVTKSGNVEGLHTLIEEGIITNEMRKNPKYAVDSVTFSQSPILKALIACGFNVKDKCKEGHSPLSLACRFGNSGAIQTLFKVGIKPDTEYFSDLCEAAYQKNKQCVAVILNNYKLPLLKSIAKEEIKPLEVLKKVDPEKVKRWGSRHPWRIFQDTEKLIASTAKKLLKEKELTQVIETINKSENAIEL